MTVTAFGDWEDLVGKLLRNIEEDRVVAEERQIRPDDTDHIFTQGDEIDPHLSQVDEMPIVNPAQAAAQEEEAEQQQEISSVLPTFPTLPEEELSTKFQGDVPLAQLGFEKEAEQEFGSAEEMNPHGPEAKLFDPPEAALAGSESPDEGNIAKPSDEVEFAESNLVDQELVPKTGFGRYDGDSTNYAEADEKNETVDSQMDVDVFVQLNETILELVAVLKEQGKSKADGGDEAAGESKGKGKNKKQNNEFMGDAVAHFMQSIASQF